MNTMKTVAIIGLGLIGGSIGQGLKQSAEGASLKIIGIPRREETIQEAIKRGAIDEGTVDFKKGIPEADIIFICTPINLIIPALEQITPLLKKGAIVTDVGSTKEKIVAEAEKLMPKGTYFVGGHPMAGKEKVKLEQAEAELFKDRIWVLTKNSKTSQKAMESIKEIVRLLDGEIIVMDVKTHDLAVAGISHMPLAIAASLVNAIADADKAKEEMKSCAASGFRDTTRIASGDPVLGVDMFTTNKKAVLKMISAFKKSLSQLEGLIKESDADGIEKLLEKAKGFRDSIYG